MRRTTVNILSVASIKQLPLLHAQQRTFASHISVRNFFNATEADDADPSCHSTITFEHVQTVSQFCRKTMWQKLSPIFRYMKRNYARVEWLKRKRNPMGWLCAQPRPYAGLLKAFLHYNTTRQPLPDYFLILDDDSYYNMELFQRHFETRESSRETYHAGCLVRHPTWQVNFTFPNGGFGSIISAGALSNMLRSIRCPGSPGGTASAREEAAICRRLQENNVGELRYFENGMNLVELMYRYTSEEKYRDVHRWTQGFCMHSVSVRVPAVPVGVGCSWLILFADSCAAPCLALRIG